MPRPLLVVLAAALSFVACKKATSSDAPTPPFAAQPTSTAELDALWALAPDGAKMGFVVSPRGLAMIEHAWQDIEAFVKTAPELAPFALEMQAEIQKKLGVSSLSLAAAGLSADKGFATFGIVEKSTVVIAPVVDRDKFLAAVKGTKGTDYDTIDQLRCKTVRGRYACAEDVAQLDKLGGGAKLRDQLAPAGTRGEIELAGEVEHVKFAVVAQLARGAFVVRGSVTGLPRELKDVGWGKSAPRAPKDAAGFFVIAMQPAIEKLAKQAPDMPLFSGATAKDAANAIVGVVTVVVPGGTSDIDARAPLRDGKPIAPIVEHCAQVPPVARLGATFVDGKCHIAVPQAKGAAADIWVDGDELRATITGLPASGTGVAMTAIGDELAHGEWAVAMWGRGTMLAGGFGQLVPVAALPPELMIGLRAVAMIDEHALAFAVDGDSAKFVFAVRTAWANPDDVVAKLAALDIKDVLAGTAADKAKAIADAAPNSPFAADFRAGTGGMMALVTPLGVLAAVAVPAFLEYMKRSKKSEPEANLNRIGKNAKRMYNEVGQFPAGKAARLPANAQQQFGNNCCGGRGGTIAMPGPSVNNKCSADRAAFANDPVWKQLELSIDEPTMYQYEYASDGKTFTARAIGDVDCDGVSATWELRGSISAAGNPVVELVKPPPGVY